MLQGLPTDTAALLNLGELMFQSHASYRCKFMHVLRCTVMLDMLQFEIHMHTSSDMLHSIGDKSLLPCCSRCGLGSKGTDLLVGALRVV